MIALNAQLANTVLHKALPPLLLTVMPDTSVLLGRNKPEDRQMHVQLATTALLAPLFQLSVLVALINLTLVSLLVSNVLMATLASTTKSLLLLVLLATTAKEGMTIHVRLALITLLPSSLPLLSVPSAPLANSVSMKDSQVIQPLKIVQRASTVICPLKNSLVTTLASVQLGNIVLLGRPSL